MNNKVIKTLKNNWQVWPPLDREGFLNEGLHEVASQILLLLFSGRSEESLNVDCDKIVAGFKGMTRDQVDFFNQRVNQHVHSLLKGNEEQQKVWSQCWESFQQRFTVC